MFNAENLSYTLNGKEIKLRDMSQQDVATFTPADVDNLLTGLYSYYESLIKANDQNKLYWNYRMDLVDLLWELAGDEYDYDGLRSLARTTDEGLIDSLESVLSYITDNAENYIDN